VTTPQEASLGVVRKGIAMFEKVNVPILGIVENMSYFTAPGGERVEIFGHGGGAEEAVRQGTAFLGEVPIFTEIREGGDAGVPVVVAILKVHRRRRLAQWRRHCGRGWNSGYPHNSQVIHGRDCGYFPQKFAFSPE